jgi:hypothetical protein
MGTASGDHVMTVTEVELRLTALENEVAELRKLLEEEQLTRAMRRSKEQFDEGLGKPAREVAEALARKHGIKK